MSFQYLLTLCMTTLPVCILLFYYLPLIQYLKIWIAFDALKLFLRSTKLTLKSVNHKEMEIMHRMKASVFFSPV